MQNLDLFRKTTLLVLVALLLTSGNLLAQRRGFSPEQMRQRFESQNKDLVKVLALTDEQLPLVQKILTSSVDERLALFADRTPNGGFQGVREQMQKLTAETRKRLSDVLTKEQMSAYDEFQSQRGQRGRRGARPQPQ